MKKRTSLRISNSPTTIKEAFDEWHNCIRGKIEEIGGSVQIAGSDVKFRQIARHKNKRHLEFWVCGYEGTAVQLNEPGTAGSENPGTTVAIDPDGHRYIIRQGMLRKSPISPRIDEATFRRRTGLDPINLNRPGKSSTKEWHVVARLDGVSKRRIRQATAQFVRHCWNARVFGEQAANDQARLVRLFGKPERGGWYDLEARSESRRVLKLQGFVFERLEEILNSFNIPISKNRNAANYEVDGAISSPDGGILIEIKTRKAANDVYCGVGQLQLYPQIFPDLADHARVLLLPGSPKPDLIGAIQNCGIELYGYRLQKGKKVPKVRFSAAFLRRCGLSEQDTEKLVRCSQAFD